MKTKQPQKPIYTFGEEIANSISHGVGVALSIAAIVILILHSKDNWRIVSFSIYGTSLFILYLISTLYHGFTNSRVKHLFRILDHSSIYLLIAGTYTPITLISLRGPWGWSIFGAIWGFAIMGILYEIIFLGKHKAVSLILYILMGWLIIIAIKPLLMNTSSNFLIWLLAGGLCYTLGVFFYVKKKWPYSHAIWHVFVLSGSICHFMGLLLNLT